MKLPFIALLLAAIGMLGADEPSSQRRFVNNTGKPYPLVKLRDSKGVHISTLYMSGKEMVFDTKQEPIKGAGYYEAVKDNYHYVPFSKGGFGGLNVDRIEWDETGKTVAVVGLRPFFEARSNIKITSDVKKPKLKDGILYLKFEGQGDNEFKFKIVFGTGVSIEPPLPEK
ncbi:MAG: hypothetical protein ABSA77_08070 [Thermoguttaceae bacterium]|jgi:hypothetical protein